MDNLGKTTLPIPRLVGFSISSQNGSRKGDGMKFKYLLVLTASSIAFTPSFSVAQSKVDLFCKEVIPALLEFVDTISAIPVSFEDTYAELSASDKARFAEARNAGQELAKDGEEYRRAFVKACYFE